MVGKLVAVSCEQCGAPITSVRSSKSRRAGLCSRCYKRIYDKTYREQHKERYKEYAQRYYRANRGKLREKNTIQKRLWRDTNRQHYRDYQRDYKRRIRSKEWYAWEELPKACGQCGQDISTRWATRARREGFCPQCYRRRAQARYYQKYKDRQQNRVTPSPPREPKPLALALTGCVSLPHEPQFADVPTKVRSTVAIARSKESLVD